MNFGRQLKRVKQQADHLFLRWVARLSSALALFLLSLTHFPLDMDLSLTFPLASVYLPLYIYLRRPGEKGREKTLRVCGSRPLPLSELPRR